MIPIAHLVESTAFAAVIGLAALAFRHQPARTRHWLWMAASIKFLLPFSLLVWAGRHVDGRAPAAKPRAELTFVMAQPDAVARTADAAGSRQRATAAEVDESSPIEAILLALWLAGSLRILIRRRREWRSAACAVRNSRPWNAPPGLAPPPIAVRSTSAVSEPGVFGIFRPVLLLCEGIEERLSPAQLQSILSHELCHVRRRDNLAAAIHMVTEALFWFHPLVWWIGARLVEERERACDEEVLLQGSEPAVYAESILAVCQFRLEAALPCVSWVSGADLKRRISQILSARRVRPLGFARKSVLAAGGLAALAVPMVLGMAHPMAAQGQPQAPAPLAFDVVSVKPVRQEWVGTMPSRTGGRITWSTGLARVVEYAFRLQPVRISGNIPGDDGDYIFQIDATTSPTATEDQVRLMFQAMLRDRFRMEAHRETRELDGYSLTVAKGGVKIQEAKDGDPPAALPDVMKGVAPEQIEGRIVARGMGRKVVDLVARRVTMFQLADALQRQLNATVIDQTGLAGRYYFELRFAMDDAPEDADAPRISVALRNQLGIQFEKHKGPVETLVVDHIEAMPTSN